MNNLKTSQTDVSIIIVNFNTLELTKNCIDSIYEKTQDVKYEIIVVDNASVDNSPNVLSKDKRIKFIALDKNVGFGRANNIGYTHSSGKYVFLLNSDTIIVNNAIKLFYDKMEQSSNQIACMGTLLFTDQSCTIHGHSYAKFLSGLQSLYYLFFDRTFSKLGIKLKKRDFDYITTYHTFFQVPRLIGADMFIRRDVIKECGLFDPDFFMYYEETEMQFRYTKKGYFIYIYTLPQIIHLEGQSANKESAKKSLWMIQQMTKSQLLYVKKTSKSILYKFFYKIALSSVFFSFSILHPRYNFIEKKECLKHLYKILKL